MPKFKIQVKHQLIMLENLEVEDDNISSAMDQVRLLIKNQSTDLMFASLKENSAVEIIASPLAMVKVEELKGE